MKANNEAVAVKNPKTGKLVTNVHDIKKVSLDYCKNLLTNREPKVDFKKILQ